jgi:hypothetical protein
MPGAGLGAITLMLLYCLAILVAWTALLHLWIWLDVPLGPAGPLHYPGRVRCRGLSPDDAPPPPTGTIAS